MESEQTNNNNNNDRFQNIKFEIVTPNVLTWFLIIILIIILYMGLRLIEGLGSIRWIAFVICIITPFLWDKISNRMLENNFVKNIEYIVAMQKHEDVSHGMAFVQRGVKYWNNIVGLDIDENKKYYVESKISKMNLNDFKTLFISKILNTVSACIGVSFILATIIDYLNNFISNINIDTQQLLAIILFITTIISPIVVSWFIPWIWAIKDAEIRIIEDNKIINNLGLKMEKGPLRKLLGSGGFLLAIGFLSSYVSRFINETGKMVGTTTIYIIMFFSINLFVSTIITTIYLLRYHEKKVQAVRHRLAKILDIGSSEISEVKRERYAEIKQEIKEEIPESHKIDMIENEKKGENFVIEDIEEDNEVRHIEDSNITSEEDLTNPNSDEDEENS